MIKDDDDDRGMSWSDLLVGSTGSRTAAMTVLFACPRYASTRPLPIPVQVLVSVAISQASTTVKRRELASVSPRDQIRCRHRFLSHYYLEVSELLSIPFNLLPTEF